jgi:hypothetical protein
MLNDGRKSLHADFIDFSSLGQKIISIFDKRTGNDLFNFLGLERWVEKVNINFV